jgi:hypothetical protein
MARLMFAVFAERVGVDRFNNSLDILNVVEEVRIPEPPVDVSNKARKAKRSLVAAMRLALLVHWKRGVASKPERKQLQRAEFLGPKGQLLARAEQEFDLRVSQFARNILNFHGLALVGEGTYTARVFLRSGRRWRKVAETAFELVYVKPQPSGTKTRLH